MRGNEPFNPAMSIELARNFTPLARNLRKQDTWAEKLLWSWLRDRRFSGYKFRRQQCFGPHILDFFCVETFLNIELDGSQHGHPEQKEKDMERDAWLASAGVRVLRFWNARLRRDKEIIRGIIWRELQARSAHPLPDYCKPMSRMPGKSETMESSISPSPSPRPSPLGRGGNVRRVLEKNRPAESRQIKEDLSP